MDQPSTRAARYFSNLQRFIPLGFQRAFVPFLISRLLLVLIFALVPLVTSVPTSQWGTDDSIRIKLNRPAMENGLRRVALGNDSGWYLSIAQNGYEHRAFDKTKQANWAFFPLHPLLWRSMAFLTGEWFWSGLLLANLLTLVGWSLLWTLAHKLTSSLEQADDAVLFAAFWPSSYFMLFPQTEPLFFCATLLAFLATYSGRWWLAGLAGLIAGATRFNGIFLIPSLVPNWWHGERKWFNLGKLLLSGVGIAAFMVYLWSITGNPFAFKDIQITWGRALAAPWRPILEYLNHPLKVATPWNPKLLHFFITVVGLLSVITCWRRKWYGVAIFTAMTLLAPLSTGSLMSMTRYLGVSPGIYLTLSVWGSRNKRMGQLLLTLFAISMTMMCICFAAGINLGGA